jgi:hypothetical protein
VLLRPTGNPAVEYLSELAAWIASRLVGRTFMGIFFGAPIILILVLIAASKRRSRRDSEE